MLICSCALTLAACASNQPDLAETGAVTVKVDDGPGSPVKDVTVYSDADEGETVIRGKVYGTRTPYYQTYGKHVHLTIISPDGQVMAKENPRLIWRTGSKFRTATGHFTVRLPEPVPNGTVVDVVFHDTLHSNASVS